MDSSSRNIGPSREEILIALTTLGEDPKAIQYALIHCGNGTKHPLKKTVGGYWPFRERRGSSWRF